VSLRFLRSTLPAGEGDPAAAAQRQAGRRVAAEVGDALLASGAAEANRARLLAGGVLTVTTGQQAGLFTGPLYAVLKGLSAAALAEALASRLGTPVVPVFWVAGDDHDFAEINHCSVIGPDGRATRIVLRERPAEAPMLPAYREAVGADGAAALAALEALLPPSEFRATTLDWLRRAYAPDRSMAEACALALAELLGPLGVVVCRGWHAALKRSARGVILDAARQTLPLDAALAEEGRRLTAAGHEVPVEVGKGLTLIMVEDAQGRDRLRADGADFAARRTGERYTTASLERLLDKEPERVSPNVLLRPVVEAALFPTVAYVGGPGELAYLAQTGPLFERLGVPRPARVPRLSGAIIEAKVDRVLERVGLTAADLAQPEGELAARVAREDLPPGAVAALAQLRESLTRGYEALSREAVQVEKTLEKPVENARNQALHGAQEIEKKLVAALRRAGDTALQQVARAREAIYPGGAPQERILTLASFLSRHGSPVVDLLAAEAAAHARALLEGPPGRA